MADETCAVFSRLDGALDATVIHRFVVGEDRQPRALSAAEARAELGDPFATLVLLEGSFPRTAEQAIEAIKAAVDDGDPLRDQMTFVLGEGSQIPFADAPRLQRGMRFIVTLGATADGADVMVSAFGPNTTDVELMAWDRASGGFNFYRSVGDGPAWVFAGNSRHALADPTQGKGPFESHRSGSFLMKELKLPWVHWHSFSQNVFDSAFAPNDARRAHPWFTQKDGAGAATLEIQVAIPAMARWARARFDAIEANGGRVARPGRIMEQIVASPAVNLASSSTQASSVAGAPAVPLPGTFFVDADGFGPDGLGLRTPPGFAVSGEIYSRTLERFDVKLSDGNGFERRGDTHFAFLVPERAFEDVVTMREALARGLVSRRLAAALLMTDFPNPVFSQRRASLLRHTPASATIENGASTFSQEMADAILAAAEGSPAGSPEREFAELWNVGERFDADFNDRLGDYYDAISARLATQDGFDSYFELAESQRAAVRRTPIGGEFPMLFARSNAADRERTMRRDGTVVAQ